jgi:hypothetical protein
LCPKHELFISVHDSVFVLKHTNILHGYVGTCHSIKK